MNYEVEQKFRVDRFDELETRLTDHQVSLRQPILQIDCYFAHPARDFTKTDEAFRLRRTGKENAITYKGPKLDATTKTRQEIELPLPEGEEYYEQFVGLLESLGFRRVAEVHKRRRKADLNWEGSEIELSLDEVDDVGRYVELELVTDSAGLEAARQRILELASALGLTENERRSYLELLLANRVRE